MQDETKLATCRKIKDKIDRSTTRQPNIYFYWLRIRSPRASEMPTILAKVTETRLPIVYV